MSSPDVHKEAFLEMARVFGLDTSNPHVDRLFRLVKQMYSLLEQLDEMNLNDSDCLGRPESNTVEKHDNG